MIDVLLTTEQAQQIEEAIVESLVKLDGTIPLPESSVKALATIRAAKAQEFTAEQQDRFASAFDETFSKAGLPQKQDKKQGHFEQPNWAHVGQAFIDGAREAKINPDASEEDFVRAADGYTKRLFEQLDPESERLLRENAHPLTVEPVKQEPVAEVNWLGASDVKWLNRVILPNGTKLYAEPISTKALSDVQRLQGITNLLLLVRDNLLKGMSKSIQKLQAKSINEELGLSKYERSNEQCTTNRRTGTAD